MLSSKMFVIWVAWMYIGAAAAETTDPKLSLSELFAAKYGQNIPGLSDGAEVAISLIDERDKAGDRKVVKAHISMLGHPTTLAITDALAPSDTSPRIVGRTMCGIDAIAIEQGAKADVVATVLHVWVQDEIFLMYQVRFAVTVEKRADATYIYTGLRVLGDDERGW